MARFEICLYVFLQKFGVGRFGGFAESQCEIVLFLKGDFLSVFLLFLRPFFGM